MNKFNIKKNREKLSEKELQQNMNFDKFMSGYTPVNTGLLKGGKLYSIIASVSVIAGVAGYLIFKEPQSKNSVDNAPFINPPVASLNVEGNTFNCSAFGDTTLVYTTGTVIHVPAEAFVDDKGNDIKGEVQIKFREFHNAADILVSGIPMNYDSAGVSYQLESAGMFEVLAYQNNQPLHLKPGKEIAVNMVSRNNNSDDFNVYYLDTVKKQWNYISENTAANKTCIPAFEKNTEYEKRIKTAEAQEAPMNPVFPDKANPKAYNFVIDFKKDEFPELAAFNGLKFQPVESKKKLHTQLSQKVWESIAIERSSDNELYVVTFSSEKESHAIKVKPVVEGKDYDTQKREYEKRLKLYTAFLEAKKKREIEKRDSLYTLNGVFSAIAGNSDLNNRLNNFVKGNFEDGTKDLLVYRAFSVNRMGVWNSDRPYIPYTNLKKYEARFFSQQNVELLLKQLYYLKREFNSIYPVNPNSGHKILFSNQIEVVVGVGFNGEIYYLKDEEVKAVNMNANVLQVKMNKADNISTIADLKKLLEI